MNELTDGQIDALLVLHGKGDDGFHSFARGAIAADRALQASRVAELEAQLEAVGADCESWYKQNQQSIDDANKFGGERDSAWAEVERLKADALRAAVAPDSWVLVPLEPTAEMLQAGQDTPVSESDEDAPEDYKAVYRAMLAAAPHPQQVAGLEKDAEITALKAERDDLRKDAERYRRIRNGPHSDNYGDLYAMTFQGDGDIPVKGEALDRAVDAAIRKTML